MAMQFATDEWIEAFMDEINHSEAYAKAAKSWEGDFYFVVTKGAGLSDDVYMYMDLWHGKCRAAFRVDDAKQKSPTFELRAPLTVWQAVMAKKIDPIQGMMRGKLKLKGPMMQIIKTPKAATELVECATRVDTTWPE